MKQKIKKNTLNDKLLTNTIKPKFVRENTDDIPGIYEVFDELVYDPKWFCLDKNSVKTVIDIGGSIGAFTLWAYDSFPYSTIYTYEPDPDSFELLCKNIDLLENNKERVHVFNTAVWNKNSEKELYRSTDITGGSSIIFNPSLYAPCLKKESVNVKTQSINDIIDNISKPIDLLKLDCEGVEYDILYSLEKLKLNSIKHIVMEFHNPYQEKLLVKDLVNYLRNNGFIVQSSSLGTTSLGFIYAKKSEGSKNDTNTINLIIDQIIIDSDKRYSLLNNKKSVKLAQKFSRHFQLFKKKLKL